MPLSSNNLALLVPQGFRSPEFPLHTLHTPLHVGDEAAISYHPLLVPLPNDPLAAGPQLADLRLLSQLRCLDTLHARQKGDQIGAELGVWDGRVGYHGR